MRRNKLWTFLFSLIPGAGQMYQGYMKRGLSMILLFVFPIMIGAGFMPILSVLAAVVYMYSFFDSMNLNAMILDGNQPEDDYLVHLDMAQNDLNQLLSKKSHFIGWGFIVLGGCGLYKSFVEPILYEIIALVGYESPLYNMLRNILYSLPGLAVGVVFVLVGLWLVRGDKKDESFEAYKGDDDRGNE